MGRPVELAPATFKRLRIAAALWFLLEWTIFMLAAIVTAALVFADSWADDPEIADTTMHVVDWVDFGTFALWSGAIGVLTFVLAVFLLIDASIDRRSWLRGMAAALAVANLVGAAWYLISLTDGSTPGADALIVLGMLVSAALALAVSRARCSQPSLS